MSDRPFHTVRLSHGEVRRRWPPTDTVMAIFQGFDRNFAIQEGWSIDAYNVCTKILECCGDVCLFCARRIQADEVS